MRSLLCVLIVLSAAGKAAAQPGIQAARDSIVAEGKKIYRSEYASWYGTDIFMQQYKGDQSDISGYFSYADKENEVCVFYTKNKVLKILGTVIFSKDNTVSFDSAGRDLSAFEMENFLLREAAAAEIATDTSFFKTYNNTNLNLIPLIEGAKKRVYILTGTSAENMVVFGNDYLLAFDKENKLISKKKLHQNIIPVKYGDDKDKAQIGAVHNHAPESGEFITATDICTLMLYEKFAKWKQHMVVSKKYMSIWNCESDSLIIIPTGK